MRCLSGVFISPCVFHFTLRFSSRFSSHFRYQHVGIQNARENARKTREKSKTRDQRGTMFLYYTMRWVKTRVSCVLVTFWSRFGHVLVVFWSRFGHKHCQNANPTHSVIRPLHSCNSTLYSEHSLLPFK